jgi:thiol-disulfide isomerase/thioredoxin
LDVVRTVALRYIVVPLMAAATILLGYALLTGRFAARPPEATPPERSEMRVQGNVDRAWRIRSLDGKEVSFAEFEGKVVFLNFWATWCGPCVHELPSIEKLRDSINDDRVAFVLISFEAPDVVRDFAKKKNLKLPVYTARGMPPSVFARARSVIPVTYVLDRKGQVVTQQVGSADWDTLAWRDFLRGL